MRMKLFWVFSTLADSAGSFAVGLPKFLENRNWRVHSLEIGRSHSLVRVVLPQIVVLEMSIVACAVQQFPIGISELGERLPPKQATKEVE